VRLRHRRGFPFVNRQMGKLQTSDFILNKLIVDEVGYCFWMRLNAVCGGWDFPTGAKTGVSRVAARRGFYSHGPELEGVYRWLARCTRESRSKLHSMKSESFPPSYLRMEYSDKKFPAHTVSRRFGLTG
jgi:hypothetical protein